MTSMKQHQSIDIQASKAWFSGSVYLSETEIRKEMLYLMTHSTYLQLYGTEIDSHH